MLTHTFTTAQEIEVLEELSIIIDKWAKITNKNKQIVESSIAYLWKTRKDKKDQDWDDFLSRSETGPYTGR